MLTKTRIILAYLVLVVVTSSNADSGFVSLFNSESLDGWSGDPRFWRVEHGLIIGETTDSNPAKEATYLVWQGGEVADFELKVEFKLVSGNSGIQYRSFPVEGKPYSLGGYQADIAESPTLMGAAWGVLYKKLLAARGEKAVVGAMGTERAVVANVGDSQELLENIHPNDWNEMHIIAVGNQCIQKINGVITAEFSESEADRLKAGLIGLQLHKGSGMEAHFRNISLRKLDTGDKKQVLFLAGSKSHGYGAHEHKAGCHLLARCLNESNLDVIAQVVEDAAWPEPWLGYDKPDTVVMYCDGYRRHMAKEHQGKIQSLTDQGVGVACLHFGVEVDPGELGQQFLDWIGGFFEAGWSVNPHWDASFESFPEHPICNGVQPFTLRDEWYYHMRFRPEMEGVTPILSAHPPLETLIIPNRKDQSRVTNPTVHAAVEAGEIQHLAWAYQRPNGGRGFGFTGGHFHNNWMQDDFRKVVLNALVWTAKADVPEGGVSSRTPSVLDMELNQDYPKPEAK